MDIKTCGKCGATWIDGQLHWSTGKQAKEEYLAGLVCNKFGDSSCINPKVGNESGTTWAKRLGAIDKLDNEYDR